MARRSCHPTMSWPRRVRAARQACLPDLAGLLLPAVAQAVPVDLPVLPLKLFPARRVTRLPRPPLPKGRQRTRWEMAKVTSKSAGKFGVKGGKGKMAGFKPVGAQAKEMTSVAGSGGGTSPGAKITGGSGKMAKQGSVKPVKSGITSVS